jgi:DNA-binding response OmpR family regulator
MRVLLIEDDTSIERFVALALEDLPITLDGCNSIEEALRHLASHRYQLVLTDLMLKGESAVDLLRQFANQPALLGGARVAVYSAGLTSEVRAQLAPWGIWRLLDKPVPLAVLRETVMQACTMQSTPERPPETPLADGERIVVETYFGGNRALFLAFRESCRAQFAKDTASARHALHIRDAASLHRLAHSLKTVLLTLGEPETSQMAREAEVAAADSDWDYCERVWPKLIEVLECYTGAA